MSPDGEMAIPQAPFIAELGMALTGLGDGWAETRLAAEPRHLQQDGFIHAGVLGTIADHTAGAAASTLAGPGVKVLTVEYKLNLLRPAKGEIVRCRADVLKAGRTLTVAESEVYVDQKMVAKATVTLAVVGE